MRFRGFMFSITAILFATNVIAQEIIREGNIYATVDLETDGAIKVVDVYSDLPDSANDDIERWLERQTIVLPDTAAPDTRILEVQYQVLEEDEGDQFLSLGITNTNASLPQAAEKGIPVKVKVHIREDGTVASVEPESDLPPGVSEAELEQTVAQNLESDPAIIEAAQENRFPDTTQTITVVIKQREDQ